MATRTVTHPNGDLSQEEALKQLYDHPQYPKGARVAAIDKTANGWEAKLEILKQAEVPFPPKGDNDDSEAPPKPAGPDTDDEPKDEGDTPDDNGVPGEEDEGKPGEGEEGKKPSVEDQLLDLSTIVHQIAEAVGVSPHGGEEGPPHGPEGPLGPHAGPPGVPPGGPPAGPGGPPAPAAGGKPPVRPPMRPGMAPPGTTPVGAPSFASLSADENKLASAAADFVVSNQTDEPLTACQAQIEEKWGPAGFQVKRIFAGKDEEGKRVVRAKISRR